MTLYAVPTHVLTGTPRTLDVYVVVEAAHPDDAYDAVARAADNWTWVSAAHIRPASELTPIERSRAKRLSEEPAMTEQEQTQIKRHDAMCIEIAQGMMASSMIGELMHRLDQARRQGLSEDDQRTLWNASVREATQRALDDGVTCYCADQPPATHLPQRVEIGIASEFDEGEDIEVAVDAIEGKPVVRITIGFGEAFLTADQARYLAAHLIDKAQRMSIESTSP